MLKIINLWCDQLYNGKSNLEWPSTSCWVHSITFWLPQFFGLILAERKWGGHFFHGKLSTPLDLEHRNQSSYIVCGKWISRALRLVWSSFEHCWYNTKNLTLRLHGDLSVIAEGKEDRLLCSQRGTSHKVRFHRSLSTFADESLGSIYMGQLREQPIFSSSQGRKMSSTTPILVI